MKISNYWIPATLAVILIFCFIAIFITPGYGDELNYHYPLARNISIRQVLDPHSDYSSAYMPLPYLIGHALLMAAPSLISLRILNFIVFLALILAFHLLARGFFDNPWLLTLLAFANPYFLMASIVYYMYCWGPLFALLGIYFYIKKRSLVPGAFFFLLAVLCQQWMLVPVFAVLAYEAVRALEREIRFARFLINTGIVLGFQLPVAIIFVNWRGLTHPHFSSHALVPSFEHVSAVLAVIGFAMALPVLANLKSLLRRGYVPLLFILPLFWLAIPRHSALSDATHFSGFVPHLAMKINQIIGIPYRSILIFLITLGVLTIILATREAPGEKSRLLLYILAGFIAVFSASVRLTTAHVYGAMPFILLLFEKEIAGLKKAKIFMMAQYLVVGVAWLLYFVFIRAKGGGI
jgi:hypothetical protein